MRKGSSPKLSKTRPQSGVRRMFTVGAYTTSLPFRRASLPTTAPSRRASERSKLAARAIVAGRAVLGPCLTPTGPSVR